MPSKRRPARPEARSLVESPTTVRQIREDPWEPGDRERRNLQRRRPEEDQHYQAARTAHLTADERRSPQQRAVEEDPGAGARAYWITREEVLAALAELKVIRIEAPASVKKGAEKGKTKLLGWTMPKDTPVPDQPLFDFPDPPRHHQQRLQAQGGLAGKLVRHLLKWLPEGMERTITIPLTDAELAKVEKAAGVTLDPVTELEE